MSDWQAWLIVAGVLAAAEVMTLTFVLAMLAGGAAAAALLGALGADVILQALGFAVVSLIGLTTIVPAARRHRHLPPLLRTGSAALIGRRGFAVTQIDRHSGQVRLGGDVWSARPYDESLVIEPGAEIDVYAIDGATAVVHPVQRIDPPRNGAQP